MVEIIQILLGMFVLFALSRAIVNIKNRDVNILESIFWVLFWISALFAIFFPEILGILANFLGVGRGVDLGIYASIIILAYLIFRLYAYLTNIERKITKIIRTIAIKEESKENKKKTK